MKPWLSPRDTWGHFFNQSHLTPEAVGLRLCPSSQHCDTSGPTQSRGPNTITLQALVINAVIMFMRTRCDPMLQGVCVKPALTRFSILAPLHHCGRPNAGVPSSFLETQGNECLWWGPACLHGCFLNPLVVIGLWPIGTGRKWHHPLPGLALYKLHVTSSLLSSLRPCFNLGGHRDGWGCRLAHSRLAAARGKLLLHLGAGISGFSSV